MRSYKSSLFQEALEALGALQKKLGADLSAEARHDVIHKVTFFIEQMGILLAPERAADALVNFDEASETCLYGVIGILQLYGQTKAVQPWTEGLSSLFGRLRGRLARRKKVVVLTITAGNGHRAAAYAIEAGLEEHFGGDYIVTVHDIQADIGAIYESSVKLSSNVYNWFFEGSNSNDNVNILHTIGYPMFSKKLDQIFYSEQPDLVVSTFSFPGIHTWIKKTLRCQDHYIPYVTVITDSISIHFLWLAEGTDAYIVANEETKDILAEKGVPRDKMLVLGFPVHPRFYKPIDVEVERKKEGLDSDKPLFLVSVGTGGSMKDVDFLRDFAKEYGEDAQCVVVLGRNQEMLHKLQKKNYGPGVKLLGWVNDMDRWMKMADVMITKAGGATVMECVAVELPMLITKALAWQESGNIELIEKYELGLVVHEDEEVMDAVRHYMNTPKLIQEQRKNFKKLNAHNSTERVSYFLKDLMEKKDL